MTTVASFGERHFGAAQLGHKRRSACLVRIATQIYRHPGGTLPAKLHQPKDYKAMDRLMNRPEVTHAAVLAPHYERTLALMYQTSNPVLIIHDTTELDYSGHATLDGMGQRTSSRVNPTIWFLLCSARLVKHASAAMMVTTVAATERTLFISVLLSRKCF